MSRAIPLAVIVNSYRMMMEIGKIESKCHLRIIAAFLFVTLCWFGRNEIAHYAETVQNDRDADHTSSVENVSQWNSVDSGNPPVAVTRSQVVGDQAGEYSETYLKKVVEMSAYTSRIEETDSTPCISADGTDICKYKGCVVASNDYAFGTKIIVDGFGECEVKDRMNRRYTGTGNMDIYFGMDLEGALIFGRKQVRIRVAS